MTFEKPVTDFQLLSLPEKQEVPESDSPVTEKNKTVTPTFPCHLEPKPLSVTYSDHILYKKVINKNCIEIKAIRAESALKCNCHACNCKKRSLGHCKADSNALETPQKPTPFTYQIQGAIQAVWHGKTLIADEPGLGKTLQALLIIQLLKVERTLIICPPTLIANWTRETQLNIPNQTTHTITPKTRSNQPLPTTAITITSDTLLTARPNLQTQIQNWQPQLIIIDEAHRMKNPQAKRTRMTLKLTQNTPHTICLTGTPILNNPLDILPLLKILKKTHHFPKHFKDTYTTRDYWGNPTPNPHTLPDLHQRLQTHVWTRRTKADVLTQLPAKTRHAQWITLHDKDLNPITTNIKTSLENALSKGRTIGDWLDDARQYVSGLRKTTGMAKISAAVDWVINHWEGTRRPLLVWAHHTSVIETLAQQLSERLPGARVEKIYGQTPHHRRQQIVDAFQAGEISILVLQIIAAGTGLTLTRASDALFVETDWTPANNVQAEDRIHRISQTQPVTITTLIADKTIDPVVHRILEQHISVLDQLTPGSDHKVTKGAKGNSYVTQILLEYAKEILGEDLQYGA